jgi:hypothetical protein
MTLAEDMSAEAYYGGPLDMRAESGGEDEIVALYSSGYGHIGHGSGYGGHSSGSGVKEECCSIVVDMLCVAVLLAAIAGATALLGRVIQIEIMIGRRKRSFASFMDDMLPQSWLMAGESCYNHQTI